MLVFCVAALLALGWVMLYSSSMVQVGARYLVMQLVWGALGVACCVAAAAMDYRLLKKLALPLLVVAILLLGLVLAPGIGTKVNGARRWFSASGIRFQPSEFAKLAVIIALAWYGERFQRQMSDWKRGVVIPVAAVGVVLALIFVEPDRGTTILLAALSGLMLLVAGARWHHFVPPAVLGVAGLAISIWQDPMRLKRVLSWMALEETKADAGYQAYQAMIALGAGGWTGLGLGNGRQKFGFVPEHHTDFIFSIIGEELGLIATLLVVVAFVLIVICGVYIAWNSSDTFGLLLGSGVSFLVGLQAFINIGVVTSALPNKGLPLPFISYGGSNLVVMLAGIGLLLSVARRARAPEEIARIRARLIEGRDDNPFRARPELPEPAKGVS